MKRIPKKRQADLIRDAATMFARGSDLEKISQTLSVPAATLRNWRNRKSDEWNAAMDRAETLVGKAKHRKHTRPSVETITEAAELHSGGKTQDEIAAHFGVSHQTIQGWRANHRDLWDAAYLAKQQPFDAPLKPPPPRPSDPTKPARALWAIATAMFDRKASIRSEKTRNHYRFALNQFGDFLGRVPTEADLDDDILQSWQAHMLHRQPPISVNTVCSYVTRIRSIWRFTSDRGEIFTRPTFVLPPCPEVTPIALTEAELVRLFESAQCRPGLICGIPARYWWPAIFGFALCTSERKTATLSLRWDWIDLETKTVSIPASVRKGGLKSASCKLWDEVIWLLRRIIEPKRELVFPWPLCDGSFYGHMGKLLVDAQIPDDRKHKMHCLRVSHNTWHKVMTGKHSPLLMHSSPATSEKHYEDRRMTAVEPVKMAIPWRVPASEKPRKLPRAKLLAEGTVAHG